MKLISLIRLLKDIHRNRNETKRIELKIDMDEDDVTSGADADSLGAVRHAGVRYFDFDLIVF